jgi:hypothetical protein
MSPYISLYLPYISVRRHLRRLRAEAPATLASLRAHPDLMLEVMEAAI